jgi:hypothetical protein
VVKQITGSNMTGKVSSGAECGFCQNAGISTTVCAPGHVAQSRNSVEEAFDRFIRRLAKRLLA